MGADFIDWLYDYIEQMLQICQMAKPAQRTSDVWGCKNVGDFMCGFFVGQMIGTAISVFQSKYGREPLAEEHTKITEIVEQKSGQIKDAFLRYN